MTTHDWRGDLTIKDGHLLGLLAWAEKEGKLVYDLTLSCSGDQPGLMGGGRTGRWCMFDYTDQEEGWACLCGGKNGGYVPNPDPMALIAACQKSGAMVSLGHSPEKETPYAAVVGDAVGHGSSNLAALTDALFERTKRLAPTNWEKCSCIEPSGATCSVPCPDNEHLESCVCTGTGIVIKEAGNGN